MNVPVFLHIEATPNPNEFEALQGYLSQAPSVVNHYGGVVVATYDVECALDDKAKPAVFMVVSFPSREAIDSLFTSEAYQAIVPLRDKGFEHIRFYVTSERL